MIPALPFDPPAGACLLARRGSIAHGMAAADSAADIDLIGVVIAPAEHYLGLSEWGSRGTLEGKSGNYDCVFYEIRKLFRLLLAGNPNVMSLLWLRPEDYLWQSDAGAEIVRNRRLFVGRHVCDSFAAYASAQLRKMETRDPAELRQYIAVTNELKARGAHPNHKGERMPLPPGEPDGEARTAAATSTEVLLQQLRHFQRKGENLGRLGEKRKQVVLEHGYDAKNAAHCVRLLRMSIEFLETGEMTVFRPDAAELLAIRRGEWPIGRVKAHAAKLFEQAKAARNRSPLPERPDRDGAERLLVSLVRQRLGYNDPHA